MKSLIKHTLRSAADSKTQVLIIILTVAVVTAMIFAAFSMSDVFYNLNMIENDRVAQGADILLGSNSSAGELFSKARVENVLGKTPADIVRVEYFLKFTTVIKTEDATKTVLLEATDLNDYVTAHRLPYIEYSENQTGVMPAIVGATFAKNAGLSAGDTIQVYIASYDKYVKMYLMYIAADEGIFKSSLSNNILVDFSAVGSYGMVSAVYITLTDSSLIENYRQEFMQVLPAVKVLEGNNYTEVKDIVANNTLLFAIGLVFIVATMGLILLTSYMIVARKRTREMIVFKAAGASPTATALIMLLEVLIYALVGTAIGIAMGRLGMQIIVNRMLPFASSVITYNVWKFVVSAIIAIAVTVIASLAPIIAVSRKTIRELNADSPRLSKPLKPLASLILTLVCIAALSATFYLNGIWVALLSIADSVLIVVWVAYVVPIMLKGITAVFNKIKGSGGFGLGTLTPNRNKAMRTITTLTAIIIAFSFIVVQIVALVKYAVTPFSTRYQADAVVLVSSHITDEQRYNLFNSLDSYGVEEAGYMNSIDFVLPKGKVDIGNTEKYHTLYGVDSIWMLQHCSARLSDGTAERWRTTANPIVLSEDMMIRLGYKLGDSVSYTAFSQDYKDRDFVFTIVGIDYTITRYDRIGYVKFDALKDTSVGLTFFVDYKKDADADSTLLDLMRKVDSQKIERSFVLTFSEWTESEDNGIGGIMGILSILQYAVIAVGLIGIINISAVTLFDRRAEIRLYRLTGLSNKQYWAFAGAEGLAMALSGGIIGFAVCAALNTLLPVFVGIVDKYLNFDIISPLSIYISLGGIAVFTACWMFIASIRSNHKNTPLNERFLT